MRQKLLILFLITPLVLLSQTKSEGKNGDCDSLFYDNISDLSLPSVYSDSVLSKILDSLWQEGKYKKAIDLLDCLIITDSLNPSLYLSRGAFKRLLFFNDTSCLEDYKKAIRIDSNYLNAHYAIAYRYLEYLDVDGFDILDRLKDTTIYKYCDHYVISAINHFEKVIEIDSAMLFGLKIRLKDLYGELGQLDKFESISKLNYEIPANADSFNIPQNPRAYYFPIEYLIDTLNPLFNKTTPARFLDIRTKAAHSCNSWYSSYLFQFQEPILFNYNFNGEIYRFTWLRSFDEPVVIRLIHSKTKNQLIVKMSNGMGGYDPGTTEINKIIYIDSIQWNKFTNLIDSIGFWDIPPIEKTSNIGIDGAQWILEGLKDNKYHMVDRWRGGIKETARVCLYLLELSEIKIEKIY